MRVVRSSSRSRSRTASGGGGGLLLLLFALAVHRPDRAVARAYNPRAFGPGGAFRPPSSGSSARGTDRYGNAACDVVTGQGAAANPYDEAKQQHHQQQPKQPKQQRQLQRKGAPQNSNNSNISKNDVNRPVISGERASLASRYSNSFSAFGGTVQQPRQAQAAAAAPLHPAQSLLETAPQYDGDDDDSLGKETTTTARTDISTIRVVTRRGGVQKPPGYVGKTTTKKANTNTNTNTKPLAKPNTNQQQQTSGGSKADDRPPFPPPNQGAATTATQPPPTNQPMPPSASSSSAASTKGGVPQPVVSGERASMASRYANSFSPYGSTAPPPEGPAQSSRARQLVGQMRTPPASRSAGGGGGGGAGAGAGAGAADGMRPVISGDRASMDNRYSNSLSAFGDTAPAPPTIVQQQRAAKQSSAVTPRVARVGKTANAPLPPRPPPPQTRQPPKQPKQQQSAAAVDDPNRPVISGDRASLDNRYSNSFSPFTNEAASAKSVGGGGGGGGGGGRKPTDGPFPSVVQPPPMRRAGVGSSPAAPLPMSPSIGGSGRGRADAKKRKPLIIPRAEAPQTPTVDNNDLNEEMVEETTMVENPISTTASVGSVTHNGDRAGYRNQNSFSAFGDTPVAPVIGGARTDDRYGNSFDSSGNVKPQPSTIAPSSPPKARPIPPAAVMNGDRAGGRNQNCFSAFGDTQAPGAMDKNAKADIDDVTPPKEVSPRTTTATQSKAEKPAKTKPQVEAPKAVLGGARVEDIYGNSLSAFGDVDLTKMKPRRKPAARFASPASQADQKKQTGTDKRATSADSRKKETPKAVMNGARADDIYFNSFSAFGTDVTKSPKAPRQASRPAKRVPAAYTGNPDITVSQDSGISGSSASNDHDRYGNAHHVYNSHVHALKHQEPIEDDEDGGIITKKERKWIIP